MNKALLDLKPVVPNFKIADKQTGISSVPAPITWLIDPDGDLLFENDERLPLKDFLAFRNDYHFILSTMANDREGTELFDGDFIEIDTSYPVGSGTKGQVRRAVISYRRTGWIFIPVREDWIQSTDLFIWSQRARKVGNIFTDTLGENVVKKL